jgi:DNA-binding PadR family transcriptional regulator
MSEEWKAEEQLFLTHGPGREQSSSGRRFFMRGGVKYALLELLGEQPMHGYEMMKRLEEQSGGTYKPSPGSIYPTLQMLRDQGFVASHKHSDGKKIFSITEEGKIFLQEEQAKAKLDPEGGRGYGGQRECRGDHLGGGGHRFRGGREDLHGGYGDFGERSGQGGGSDESMNLEEIGSGGRNRRLAPAGKELLHLLKAAERAAMADSAKAAKLRLILSGLKADLSEIAEGDRHHE